MNSQILIYKLKKNGWLSNQILSLELAVGLSHQTDRVLFLYDENVSTNISPINAIRFGNGFTLEKDNWFKVIDNLPEYKPSTILDLYDNLPVKLITNQQLKESINSKTTKKYSTRAAGLSSCFVENLNDADQIDLKYFSEGRNIITNSTADIWNFNHPNNFGYYSRFFYNKSNKLKYCFQNLRMLSWVENLSNNISSKLNNYNACHIRLSDLLTLLPQEKNYNQIVTDVICNVINNELPLVIFSDESSSSDFFLPLKNKFKHIIFLRDFLQNECKELWQSIPWINECIIGLVCQNVLSNANIFLGTPGSTFSGIIHRKWCIKNQNKNLYYIHSGIPGSKCEVNNYFSNGLFVDKKDGPYSWNKIISKHIHNLSWYREWPECIL